MNKCIIYSPSHGIWGGGQIYIEQLCTYMNDRGLEVYIVSSEPKTFFCPAKKMDIVLSKKKRFLSAIKIAKQYKKEGFKTIILNDLSSLWLSSVFKLYGFNVVSLLHLYLQKRNENPFGHGWLEYNLLMFSSKFCDTIFSVNKNNQSIFSKEKVQFIGNYVPDWFVEASKDKKTKIYDFIVVARFESMKNIPLFLKLIKNMNERFEKNYTGLIVGEGKEQKNIEQTIIEYGLEHYVEIRGWVPRKELPSVYDLGKCFVISSTHEGFATTLLEAHARGLPSVVTKSSGFCGEFVKGYNAKTGLVFEPKDINNDMFYKALKNLLNQYATYENDCLEKAKIFSEENVLNPILQACK